MKDVDFPRHEILVRDGKGRKDRVTMLPRALRRPLGRTSNACARCTRAIGGGLARLLPDALARKFRRAARDWAWQWVFPAARLSSIRARA